MPDSARRSQRFEHTPNGKIVLRIESLPEDEPDLAEYGYVISDLKRVGVVAAAVFALLIGLSFLFR
jgi:hypothetical protein